MKKIVIALARESRVDLPRREEQTVYYICGCGILSARSRTFKVWLPVQDASKQAPRVARTLLEAHASYWPVRPTRERRNLPIRLSSRSFCT